MIFAAATDEKGLMIFSSEREAIAYCEGVDVEDGMWRFWDGNGAALSAQVVVANHRTGIFVGSGTYGLRPAPDLPALIHSLPYISYLEANPYFATLAEVQVHLASVDACEVGCEGRMLSPCPTGPAEISSQLTDALRVIQRHLGSTLQSVHLYGSALDGGLKPLSDIDLLVTTLARIDDATRRALLSDLLRVSAPPGQSETLRALEATVVVHDDIVPWRYPARRELQFGEWQRADILAGVFEPAMNDHDLAILLTKARLHSIALRGPSADACFDPVPESDLSRALTDTLAQWNMPADWEGDERNVVLALARIWYTASTGSIASKERAADWAIERLPVQHRPLLSEARDAYLGEREDRLTTQADQMEAFVQFVKQEAMSCLAARR